MPGKGKPSQNDAWVLARGTQGLISIAVEGKAGEPFDKQVGAWLLAGKSRENRQARLDGICALLGSPAPDPTLRYQLFHRGASAVIEAKRWGAPTAVLMVHAFGDAVDLRDVEKFCEYLDANRVANDLFQVSSCSGISFFIGWARSAPATDAAIVQVAG
jgi:hypothetical protein